LISDIDFDALSGTVDVEELYRSMRILYRCPVSDHLWVFWNGFDAAPTLYTPSALPQGWAPG
jgi:hypothetical protein